jgi:xanthine/CO dehydrogenase XdhC/CoxF family maturation factor
MKRHCLVLSAALLAACGSRGPPTEPPQANLRDSFRASAVEPSMATPAAAHEWEGFFADQRLQRVVGLALAENRSLRAGVAAVERARALSGVSQAARLPEVEATATAGRQRTAGSTAGSYGVSLGLAAWEVDLFDRVGSLEGAALSRFLAQIAVGMDYAVTVCDPREEYRDGWSVEGVQVVHAMPDDLVMEMRLDSRSAVVALTHDPKLDDLALMEALKSEAFYVGAIGSRSNDQKRRERLVEFDLTPEQLAKLHGPIGIYIGSKTPSEIAISILAELTAVKNSVELPDIMQVRTAKEAANTEASPDACLLDPSQRIV